MTGKHANPIRPAQLGGTLFVPATHPGLRALIEGSKYPRLRSLVIDFEDGIDADKRPKALERLRPLLPSLGGPEQKRNKKGVR